MDFNLFNGDCLDVLKTLPDNSVDSIVTDPPYGLSNQSQDDIVKCLTAWLADEAYTHGSGGFMGKKWDSFVPSPTVWKECLRVLKHGGHIACFAGSRTQDLMGISLRLAGFELRDVVMWVYGSGFPKGLDIAKGIDGVLGKQGKGFVTAGYGNLKEKLLTGGQGEGYQKHLEYKPSDQAKQWEGWNTNLKPAYEPIILARKPLDGTVVNNVLKHGVGGLNIDACRVGTSENDLKGLYRATTENNSERNWKNTSKQVIQNPIVLEKGRYPANLIHDGSEEATGGMPWSKSGGNKHNDMRQHTGGSFGGGQMSAEYIYDAGGSASRYFYCAKASKADRDEGLKGFELKQGGVGALRDGTRENTEVKRNIHPTVKPTALMQYVTKLITPLNGTVLDPFMGSGSTGKACMLEGFNFTGIELSPEYLAIAEARIQHAQSLANRKQLKLEV